MRVWIEDRHGDGKMVVAGVCCKVVLATGVVIVVVTGLSFDCDMVGMRLSWVVG